MKSRVRASYVKELLDEVDADPRRGDILGHVDAALVAAIRKETPVAWVDAAQFEKLLVAIDRGGGEPALLELSRRHVLRFQKNPLFKTTLDAIVRVFGLTPFHVLKLVPRSRGAVIDDGARVAVERVDDNACRLTVQDFFCTDWRTSMLNMRGAWEAILTICKVDGEVVLEQEAPKTGLAVFLIRYRA